MYAFFHMSQTSKCFAPLMVRINHNKSWSRMY